MRLAALAFVLSIGAVAAAHDVDTAVTPADRAAVAVLLPPATRTGALADDIEIIRSVQGAVLRIAPDDTPIPMDHPREPADLLRAGSGLCYDRSRTIEKALTVAGFGVRHVFLVDTSGYGPFALAVSGVQTHAVTEVETVSGWLTVDSIAPWVSLSRAGEPVPAHAVSAWEGGWLADPPSWVSDWETMAVPGLYSRHGRFFAPYGWLPDVDYAQLSGATRGFAVGITGGGVALAVFWWKRRQRRALDAPQWSDLARRA